MLNSPDSYFKPVFEWLSLAYQFASLIYLDSNFDVTSIGSTDCF